MSGTLIMANQQQVRFREALGNGVNHIALQAPAIVSADRIITLPDETGTVVTTGDSGSVTSTMILDGTILNADINASAAIAGTKISPNFGSQNVVTTGTATAASLIPTGSSVPTNGVYLPAANNVAISTNGTGRLFVASDGKVLHNHSGAVATNPFSSSHIPRLVTTSTETTNFQGLGSVAYNGSIAGLWLGRSAGTTVNTVDALTSGNEIGGISFAGADGTGFIAAARIRCIVDGAVSTTTVPGALTFQTSASGSSPSERMRITSAGLVGLGTSSPTAPLTVIGANNTTQAIFSGTLGTTNRGLRIATDVSSGNNDIAILDAQAPAGQLVFQTVSTERLRITNTGNVGIGTTSPAALLHANGTIRYTNRPAAGTITAIGFDTNGDLKASSSSLRYKHDIADYVKGLDDVMQLRPVSFKFNGEENTNIGFIAEEVDQLGLTEVMLYDEDGQPEGIIYANMVSLLTKAIQEQQAMIAELQTKVAALEA
jgi:hypothetical protein